MCELQLFEPAPARGSAGVTPIDSPLRVTVTRPPSETVAPSSAGRFARRLPRDRLGGGVPRPPTARWIKWVSRTQQRISGLADARPVEVGVPEVGALRAAAVDCTVERGECAHGRRRFGKDSAAYEIDVADPWPVVTRVWTLT